VTHGLYKDNKKTKYFTWLKEIYLHFKECETAGILYYWLWAAYRSLYALKGLQTQETPLPTYCTVLEKNIFLHKHKHTHAGTHAHKYQSGQWKQKIRKLDIKFYSLGPYYVLPPFVSLSPSLSLPHPLPPPSLSLTSK